MRKNAAIPREKCGHSTKSEELKTMSIRPNTEAFEREVLVAPSGFREYDARWLYPEQINLRGMQALGKGIGTMIREHGVRPDIIVGHDYRSYSAALKQALVIGLIESGCRVHDIGLALSPVAYFAQFELDCPAVAMVTASHNENGWTGVKIGAERPLTFGPDEMNELKDMVLGNTFKPHSGGSYRYVEDVKEAYIADLVKDGPLNRKLKVVTACGNGTAGMYAPQALRGIGCEVVELDCEPDYRFLKVNPNPEDMTMLHAMRERILETGADFGVAFDGDGDRCGVVDDMGEELFADKMGVMLARYLSKIHGSRRFVVDVKSTGLYMTDPVLRENNVETEYWKTGHSYIKRRVNEIDALAGFEKSGHFFFNEPIGRGYDDGLLSAITICRMMDDAVGEALSALRKELPQTWGSPTMSPYCPDECKYDVVERFRLIYEDRQAAGAKILNQSIREIVTVNGARIVLQDGTWGLVRASSNKPCLVVVVESPVSEIAMRGMFREIDDTLSTFPEVGEYDQKLGAAA
ncbi:MAG: phosphomannomutase/phosphoglucomutase [Alphaproteobacteria bacterium]|nr:phosphomannomutase/phosphoglucomutase [Alphaproteobacteria bacterium]